MLETDTRLQYLLVKPISKKIQKYSTFSNFQFNSTICLKIAKPNPDYLSYLAVL